MKTVRTLGAVLCASVVVLSLAACKSDGDDKKSANASVVSGDKACAGKTGSCCSGGGAAGQCTKAKETGNAQ